MSSVRDPVSFLGRCLPRTFELRLLALAPGGAHVHDAAAWLAAIVVVERGEIELECSSGTRFRFRRGAVLWLSGLPLRALRNPGLEQTLLVGVARRRGHEPASQRQGSLD